jgi:hypothetical protein
MVKSKKFENFVTDSTVDHIQIKNSKGFETRQCKTEMYS